MPAAKTIDEYLEGVPNAAREALETLRKRIHEAAPGATETISYQLPTFKHEGRHLVAIGAWKNHCSLYLMSTSVAGAHRKELAAYDNSKGTVRFQPDKPLPASLVRKLVKARIVENEASLRSKERTRTTSARRV